MDLKLFGVTVGNSAKITDSGMLLGQTMATVHCTINMIRRLNKDSGWWSLPPECQAWREIVSQW